MSTEYTPDEVDAAAYPAEPEVAEPVVAEPKAKTKTKVSAGNSLPPSAPGQAVTGEIDEVLVRKLVFKGAERKSLSVHHLQRRLAECGYKAALTDRDGWLTDGTVQALTEFQLDNQLPVTGKADPDALRVLFADDPNVVVVAD